MRSRPSIVTQSPAYRTGLDSTHAYPRHAPKFLINRKPTDWLFSGWNWQATILSFQMVDTKGPPYVVVVTATTGSAGSTKYEWTKYQSEPFGISPKSGQSRWTWTWFQPM